MGKDKGQILAKAVPDPWPLGLGLVGLRLYPKPN